MSRRFAVTFDYLCPFARNVHEHLLDGLEAGADWDVDFTAYSQAQGAVEDGGTAVWDRDDPDRASGVLALQVGLAARDHFPAHFPAVHRGLFAARHDRGEDIRDRDVLTKTLRAAGLDADEVFAVVERSRYLDVVREEHQRNATVHEVWGVPTFVTDTRGVFIRLLDRPGDDVQATIARIERIVDLVDGVAELHEFKQVDLPV